MHIAPLRSLNTTTTNTTTNNTNNTNNTNQGNLFHYQSIQTKNPSSYVCGKPLRPKSPEKPQYNHAGLDANTLRSMAKCNTTQMFKAIQNSEPKHIANIQGLDELCPDDIKDITKEQKTQILVKYAQHILNPSNIGDFNKIISDDETLKTILEMLFNPVDYYEYLEDIDKSLNAIAFVRPTALNKHSYFSESAIHAAFLLYISQILLGNDEEKKLSY